MTSKVGSVLRAAVLALDGVLADLTPARVSAFGEALAAEGVTLEPEQLAAAARSAADLGNEAAFRAALAGRDPASPASEAPDETTVALAVHRAERLLGARLRHAGVTLAPGATAAVAALGARLRLALVTALPRADAHFVLDAAGLAPAFGVVVAGDDRAAAGPAAVWPAAAARLAARLPGLVPADVAAFTAGAAGAAAARAAGLRVVRVGFADHGPADAPGGGGPHARLGTLQGLTPATLACALDLAPHLAPTARPR